MKTYFNINLEKACVEPLGKHVDWQSACEQAEDTLTGFIWIVEQSEVELLKKSIDETL